MFRYWGVPRQIATPEQNGRCLEVGQRQGAVAEPAVAEAERAGRQAAVAAQVSWELPGQVWGDDTDPVLDTPDAVALQAPGGLLLGQQPTPMCVGVPGRRDHDAPCRQAT